MYMIKESEKVVPIPPTELEEDIASVIDKLTWETYEGTFDDDKDFTILIRDVVPIGEGRIVHGEPEVYQTVKYTQVVYRPKLNELVDGVVAEITKFGAFVKFGPFDGLVHVSQVMDERVDADENGQRLVGADSNKSLSVGDRVRARIISIEINDKSPGESRFGLTMRQPGLGKLDWIEQDSKGKGEQ